MCACYKLQILVSISMQQSAVKTCLCERRPDYRPNEWKLHSITLSFYRSLCGLWLIYKLNRRAIHSNYSDSQCFRTPKWLNCQHNLSIIAFRWMSVTSHVWRTNVIKNQVGLMAGSHFQPFRVCFVGKSESLPLCLCTVVGVVEGRTGVIVASQLFCSMLGEPDIQREGVRWRTPSKDASFAWGESKLRRHFLSARATWLAREVQAACLQLLALWKNLREEDFSNGSSIGELDGGVSLHWEQMDS